MIDKRRLLHTVFLLLSPLIVAWFGWSFTAALALVMFLLLWRWLISLSTFTAPDKAPTLVLETIPASHFVEKVRWNMDVAGLDYLEKPAAGTLGAFFAGRTVPRLRVRTGLVRSQIGNSAEILRYLYGRYVAADPARAAFLEPTKERLEFEKRLDAYPGFFAHSAKLLGARLI